MKRDSTEVRVKDFLSRISFREVVPKFRWCQCNECGYEFLREKMYKVRFHTYYFSDVYYLRQVCIDVCGCSHCFANIEEFKKHCYEKYLKNIIEAEIGEGNCDYEWAKKYL